jgi:hydrogenase expression/formation protein HypD
MEVCGTHTVNACRSGVHSLMPDNVVLVSGPGCPVCVTAQRYIDALVELGRRDDVTLLTYGDMIRVAGAGGSLELARSEGADVRVVTSTLEAVDLARREPDRQMVFAAVGFETTAPATAAAVLAAQRDDVRNFTVLPCHKLVLPAMRTLLADPDVRIDGFLCPGHVSVIIGAEAYRPIVEEFGKACVVTGFEALQIMDGVLHLVRQAARDEVRLENLYPEVVSDDGNPRARALIDLVFEPGSSAWRALGEMPGSGLDLRPEYAAFDAFRRFDITLGDDHDPPGCRCGEVITGKCEPPACRLFGTVCTPIYPVGPCMVSSEGTCQAWFKYRRHERDRAATSRVGETVP